jgi:hypothetical protein
MRFVHILIMLRERRRSSSDTIHSDAWFPLGLADAGTFCQILAVSALHLESLRKGVAQESQLSIRFHSKAIANVREHLANDSLPTTENILASIGGFLTYDVSGTRNVL